MELPRVVQITAAAAVPEGELHRRLDAVARTPPDARSRYAVQLRDPELSGRALLALGERLRRATRALGVSLWINDRLDLALFLGAEGVHLGRRSVSIADARALLPAGTAVSVACHSVAEVVAAAAAGADMAVLSPIFATPGKGPPLGLSALESARAGAPAVHLVALGGVAPACTAACFAAGADAVAAIRADLVDVLSK